jgi:hypothetical protein
VRSWHFCAHGQFHVCNVLNKIAAENRAAVRLDGKLDLRAMSGNTRTLLMQSIKLASQNFVRTPSATVSWLQRDL